jgi:type II secretory ATPase GspE/PulE/Tfp pilus assembly ATPase PilB-like protein
VKLLDPAAFPPALGGLGFPEGVTEACVRFLRSEAGLLLIASPSFSGASSSMHALARHAARSRAVALVESPRAVDAPGLVQTEFFPEIRNSLTQALERALAAEVRALAVTSADGVAWDRALAALPEHLLVMARVEGITLPEALLRLRFAATGYPAAALATRRTLVVHQRLLRRICAGCRMPAGHADEHAAALGLATEEAGRMMLWRGAGCDACAATPGFRGRVPLAHVLVPNEEVARAVASGSPEAVREACRGAGLQPMRREALAALAAGLTTVEEITRRRMG